MGEIYQPWDQVNYEVEYPETRIFDIQSGETITRIPATGLTHTTIKNIYETMRREYLLGYAQGVEDKTNELRAALGCR